jgi:hypothetical protein
VALESRLAPRPSRDNSNLDVANMEAQRWFMAEQLVAIVDLSTGHSPHDAGSQFLRANVAARQRLAIRSVPVFEVAQAGEANARRTCAKSALMAGSRASTYYAARCAGVASTSVLPTVARCRDS